MKNNKKQHYSYKQPLKFYRYYSGEGIKDISDGFKHWRLWYLIGSADMRRRYARSKLGQVWVMLSSLITVSTMGLVWSYLWNQPIKDMLPFVAVGTIVWQLFSGILSESTTVHESNKQFYLNQYMPASAILLALIYRYSSLFSLNLLFPLLTTFLFGNTFNFYTLTAIIGLIVLLINCFWMSFLISIICIRFRDMIQIILSLLLILNYLTPVVWKPENLPKETQDILALNPLASVTSIVRDPLLGRVLPDNAWTIAIILSLCGLLITLPIIGYYRRRIIYWL
jgi:ABC-type polysaccharide/polyol phosphate export permease